MQEAINTFAADSFGAEYTVAPIGESCPVQLLSLAIKKTRSWWKCSFLRSEKEIIGHLRDFTKSFEVKNEFEDFLVKAVRESSDYIKMAERSASSNHAKMELKLGKLMEESLEDKDLRELLQITELDRRCVEEHDFKNQNLFIVTGIVYSEKLQVVGEGIIWKRAHSISRPSSLLMCETKGPLIFKYYKVEYDSKENRLRLAKDVISGGHFR